MFVSIQIYSTIVYCFFVFGHSYKSIQSDKRSSKYPLFYPSNNPFFIHQIPLFYSSIGFQIAGCNKFKLFEMFLFVWQQRGDWSNLTQFVHLLQLKQPFGAQYVP
eukprot:94661_1